MFGLGGRDVVDRLRKASVVEPIDPFEPREFDGLKRFPRSTATDYLGLLKAVDGFGERVVIAVADTADGWFDANLNQAFGVFNRDILVGFNWASQRSSGPTAGVRQMPRQVFSSRASCAAWC